MSSIYTDYSNVGTIPASIQSTAGAVTIVNEKGKLVTEKVRVSRYISGKRPEYAPVSSDEDEEVVTNEFMKIQRVNEYDAGAEVLNFRNEAADRRLQRLRNRPHHEYAGEGVNPIRHHHQAVLMDDSDSDDEDDLITEARRPEHDRIDHGGRRGKYDNDSSASEDEGIDAELDEEEISNRRAMIRMKNQAKPERELMEVEDEEAEGGQADNSSEWEEYTDSSEDSDGAAGDGAAAGGGGGARLKPVFVRRRDRVTIQEKELADERAKEIETVDRRNAENRRKETLKMVEVEVRKEMDESRVTASSVLGDIASVIGDCERLDITTVDTADENDDEQVAYEEWKLRELKRIKRDRDQREAMDKDKEEVNKLHNATEEERFKYFKQNPKEIVNKAQKGKYKFLQKFYHRGAFFLDEQDQVFTRDVTQPTLDDHFDKTVLPRVMQVKNFGRSGRTKYTHLVDQDTTSFDSPWTSDTAMSLKFQKKGQNSYEKPTNTKKKP